MGENNSLHLFTNLPLHPNKKIKKEEINAESKRWF